MESPVAGFQFGYFGLADFAQWEQLKSIKTEILPIIWTWKTVCEEFTGSTQYNVWSMCVLPTFSKSYQHIIGGSDLRMSPVSIIHIWTVQLQLDITAVLYSAKLAINLSAGMCQFRLHYFKVFDMTKSCLYKSKVMNRISHSVEISCCLFLPDKNIQ